MVCDTEEVSSESSRKMQDKGNNAGSVVGCCDRMERKGGVEAGARRETETPEVRVEQAQAKMLQKRREVPCEEGEEVNSPKKKSDSDQEEAEEISFVPSAISVPPKPKFRCDNRCSEKPPQLLAVRVGSD